MKYFKLKLDTPQNSQLQQDIKKHLNILVSMAPYSSSVPPPDEVSKYLTKELTAAGFKPAIKNSFILDNCGWKTVLGIKGSRKRPIIMFQGHYDVVKDDGNWISSNKHKVKFISKEKVIDILNIPSRQVRNLGDEIAIGKGTADMLGSIAVILSVVNYFKLQEKGTIMVMFVPDEEQSSEFGMKFALTQLTKHNLIPDYVLGGESTFLEVLTDRRGIALFDVNLYMRKIEKKDIYPYVYRIKTTGNNMHAGLFTMKKRRDHAIMNMSHILSVIGKDIQIFKFEGGNATNVVPSRCEAIIAVTKPLNINSLEKKGVAVQSVKLSGNKIEIVNVVKILEKLSIFRPTVKSQSQYGISILPNIIHGNTLRLAIRLMQSNFDNLLSELETLLFSLSAHIKLIDATPPFHQNRTSSFVKGALLALKSQGIEPKVRENYGTSDSNLFYTYRKSQGGRIRGIIEVGGIGFNEHRQNEWIDIRSLITLAQIYSTIIYNLIS